MFKLLKVRAGRLQNDDKVSCLVADEISLKKSIDYDAGDDKLLGLYRDPNGGLQFHTGALFLLVAGIKGYWRQAFSYSLVRNPMKAEDLKPLLFGALQKLEETGLRVKVFATDQGSNFWSFMLQLGVTEKQPYFLHNDRKIFAIADCPHLMKSLQIVC